MMRDGPQSGLDFLDLELSERGFEEPFYDPFEKDNLRMKSYQDLYVVLKRFIASHSVIVSDSNPFGWAMSRGITRKKGTSFYSYPLIYVNPSMSWQNRFYTLCHEVSHSYYFTGNNFKELKHCGNENTSNRRALRLIRHLRGRDETETYNRFYQSVVKKLKKIKKV